MWEDLDHDRFFSDPSRRPPRIHLVVVVSAIVSAATAAVLYFIVAGTGNGKPVPALVGMPLHQALTRAQGQGLRLVVTGSTPDPLVGKGAVASQTPLAGSPLPEGSAVRVVLSDGLSAPRGLPLPAEDGNVRAADAGPRRALHKRPKPRGPAVGGETTVPRLIGLRQQQAARKLREAGFAVGRVSSGIDEDRMDGRVLRQRPAAGVRAVLGSRVDIVINNTEGL